MAGTDTSRSRGISPVVGVALLIAIVLVLSVVMGAVFLNYTDSPEDPPDTALRLEPADEGPEYLIRHGGGETFGGEEIVVEGVADPELLADRNLSVTDTVEVIPTSQTITVLYFGNDESYTLASWDVDESNVFETDTACPSIESSVANGSVTIDDETIDCDITSEVDAAASDVDVDVESGGVVVGDLGGEVQNVDVGNGGRVVGDVDATGDVDVDSARIDGDVQSSGDDVALATGTEVHGSVVVSPGTNVDLDGTTIHGDVVIHAGDDGEVNDLSNATIVGDVYVDDASDLVCGDGDSTIAGQHCSTYSPKDPAAY